MRVPFIVSYLLPAIFCVVSALGQAIPPRYEDDSFRQLEELLPTPNDYRAASGAPGERYWQQRADYDIRVTLDETHHALTAEETITYHNHAPLPLTYLWLQLDQNRFKKGSIDHSTKVAPDPDRFYYNALGELLEREGFEGGVIAQVSTSSCASRHYR